MIERFVRFHVCLRSKGSRIRGGLVLCAVAASFVILTRPILAFTVRASTAAAPGNQDANKSGSTAANAIAAVPFEFINNHIYVPVHVNGSDTLSFMLDTGASISFLSERVARSLSLNVKNEFDESVGTGEGKIKIGFARDIVLNLGQVGLRAKQVAVIPTEGLESALGRRLDGVLGSEVFKRYVVEIDFERRCLKLYEPGDYAFKGTGETMPLKLVGDRPFIRARVAFAGAAGIDATMVVDIGDSSALSFHTPFVKKYRLPSAATKTKPNFTLGLGGKSPELLCRAETFEIGRYVIKAPVTALAQATQGSMADSSYDGAVGTEILRRFRITFNYSAKLLYVEGNAAFPDPFDVDMSGLSLTFTGVDLMTIVIEHVDDQSPAADAGVRSGDVIIAIDGKPASELTVAQIKKLFRQEGIEYVLGIRRGDTTLRLKLKTRRLI